MAYNFKSIADVEVVAEPAESANVLIEENGVIKRAPKTAVGGKKEDNVIDTVMLCFDWFNDIVTVSPGIYDILMEKMLFNFIGVNFIVWFTDEYGSSSQNFCIEEIIMFSAGGIDYARVVVNGYYFDIGPNDEIANYGLFD